MEPQVYEATIKKGGHLELRNLPFEEGSVIRISISAKGKGRNMERVLKNDHVWNDDDIKAVRMGRELINQWKIS